MNTCYKCRSLATYTLVANTRPWWRRLLHLGRKVWHTCPLHRYDPVPAGLTVARHRD